MHTATFLSPFFQKAKNIYLYYYSDNHRLFGLTQPLLHPIYLGFQG